MCVCVCVCFQPDHTVVCTISGLLPVCTGRCISEPPATPRRVPAFFFFFKVETERMFTYVQNSSESLQKNLVVIVAFGE